MKVVSMGIQSHDSQSEGIEVTKLIPYKTLSQLIDQEGEGGF